MDELIIFLNELKDGQEELMRRLNHDDLDYMSGYIQCIEDVLEHIEESC